ncbi:hypothetical protein GA0115254_100722 [Streptomyces sp. Ncost-T10-10d]|nr:hypothetical protein GA0115254_100722 [Streptomyces sp. Ncost-T10-10d]
MASGQEPAASVATPGPERSSSATRRPDTASSRQRAGPVASGPVPIDSSVDTDEKPTTIVVAASGESLLSDG